MALNIPAGVSSNATVRVTFVPDGGVANPAAPTVSELEAGTDISCHLMADGFNPGAEEATTDGRRLIMSDGTDQLRFLDPDTLAETGRVSVTADGKPLTQINELEWIDGEVFANLWQDNRIARIDPETGVVKAFIDLSALVPRGIGLDPNDDVLNGIAWDASGRRLFVTGKRWPQLFEIRLR